LKKTDEVGMPTAIKEVVDVVAGLRNSTPERMELLVQTNFSRLVANDPWVRSIELDFEDTVV
jgi:hypothetical protein